MPNANQLAFLEQTARAAVLSETRTSFPASVTVAQAILESGWGQHCPGSNAFGIKAHDPWPSQMLSTVEVISPRERQPGDVVIGNLPHGLLRVRGPRAFAAYPSLADCFADHAALLLKDRRYHNAWADYLISRDIEQLALDIAPLYATAPNYGAQLVALMRQQDVVSAIAAARIAV